MQACDKLFGLVPNFKVLFCGIFPSKKNESPKIENGEDSFRGGGDASNV